MATLALDLALTTGWALRDVDQGGELRSGLWNLRPGTGRPHQSPGLNLWWWLTHAHALYGLTCVVQERPFTHKGFPGTNAVPFGLQMATQMWCEHKGLNWSAVPPATIKKHATGKGNARKEAMLETARVRWPELDVDDHNAADALWLLDYATKGTT